MLSRIKCSRSAGQKFVADKVKNSGTICPHKMNAHKMKISATFQMAFLRLCHEKIRATATRFHFMREKFSSYVRHFQLMREPTLL